MGNNMNLEIANMYSQIVQFGYGDVEFAIETALEVGYDGEWVGEQIHNFVDDTAENLEDVDPCYVVFDALLQEARNDICNLINIDILNDLDETVNVYGNYMDTSIDHTEIAKEDTLKVIKKIPFEDITCAIDWLKGKLE